MTSHRVASSSTDSKGERQEPHTSHLILVAEVLGQGCGYDKKGGQFGKAAALKSCNMGVKASTWG